MSKPKPKPMSWHGKRLRFTKKYLRDLQKYFDDNEIDAEVPEFDEYTMMHSDPIEYRHYFDKIYKKKIDKILQEDEVLKIFEDSQYKFRHCNDNDLVHIKLQEEGVLDFSQGNMYKASSQFKQRPRKWKN